MDHASAGFASPWAAAVLGGHAMGSTNTEHGFGHHGLSMDLHGYSYYRCEANNIISFCHALHTRIGLKNKRIKCRVIYGPRSRTRSLRSCFSIIHVDRLLSSDDNKDLVYNFTVPISLSHSRVASAFA